MKETLYDKIYRIWEYGGGKETIAYDKDSNPIVVESISGNNIWHYGIKVGNRIYTLETLWMDSYGDDGPKVAPSNYAQLFAGEFDIIEGIADAIKKDLGLKEE